MYIKIKRTIYILLLKVKALEMYINDYKLHIKFSVNYHSRKDYSKDMLRCSIMLLNHQLEKAQTYSNMRTGYGQQKIYDIINLLEKYIDEYGFDSLVYTSIGVLNAHLKNKYSYKNEDIINRYRKICDQIPDKNILENRGGIEILNLSKNKECPGLLKFLHSRHSCRIYSDQEVKKEEIEKAIEYAMTAPSACNRQAVRAHYYNDRNIIKKIVESQKSDIAWCLNAKGLFIITANKSYYRDFFERNQGMFDSGLFSMNLVIGLHNLGIGSCFKMAQKDIKIDRNTKEIADIPLEEDICVLLLIGKYPEEEIIFAKSSRLDKDEILKLHFES